MCDVTLGTLWDIVDLLKVPYLALQVFGKPIQHLCSQALMFCYCAKYIIIIIIINTIIQE